MFWWPPGSAAGCNGFCDGSSLIHKAIIVAFIGQGHRGLPVPRGHESRQPLHLGALLGSYLAFETVPPARFPVYVRAKS